MGPAVQRMDDDLPADMSAVLNDTSVVISGTGSQSAEEVPLLQTELENTTPQERQKHHEKKGHTDDIEIEEFDGQYDEIDVHFVGPYPDMASDPDEIMINDINRPWKADAYTIVNLPADCEGKTNASI